MLKSLYARQLVTARTAPVPRDPLHNFASLTEPAAASGHRFINQLQHYGRTSG